MRLCEQIEIAAPRERVFEALTQVTAHPGLTDFIIAADPPNPAPLAVGSRWRQTLRVRGSNYETEQEVLALEPPGLMRTRSAIYGFEIEAEAVLTEPTSGACRLALTLDFMANTLPARLLVGGFSVLEDKASTAMRREMDRIARKIEAGG